MANAATDNNDDNWKKAIDMLTGYVLPSQADAIAGLTGNNDIPLMHVRLERIQNSKYYPGFASLGGWRKSNTDFVYPYHRHSEDALLDVGEKQGWVSHYIANITFVGRSGGAETPPSGDDGISMSGKQTSDVLGVKDMWNLEGEEYLGYDTSALARYVGGSIGALDKLVYEPYSTQGYEDRGISVADNAYTDLKSFTQVAKAFDRAARFFAYGANTIMKWDSKDNSDSWDGTGANVFKGLIHALARNYEHYADQVTNEQLYAPTPTLDGEIVGHAPARELSYLQQAIHSEAVNLHNAWHRWKPESNPHRWLYDMLMNAWGYQGIDELRRTGMQRVGGKTYVYAEPEFENTVKIYEKPYGSPNEAATWKAVGEDAVTKWKESARLFLGAMASDSLKNIQDAMTSTGKVFDMNLGNIDNGSLANIAEKEEADKEKRDAKKERDEAKKQNEEDRKDAKAAADDAKKQNDEARKDAKAAADDANKKNDEAQAEADARAAKADAQNEADRAQAEADRAQQQADQKQAQAEATAAQDKAQAEADVKGDQAQAEADARQAKADAQNEADRAQAEADREQQQADQKQAQAEATAAQDKAQAQNDADRAQAKNDAAGQAAAAAQATAQQQAEQKKAQAEAKAEQKKARAEADAEQEKAQAEADARQEKADAQNEADRAQAEADRAQQQADQKQAQAEAASAQEKADAQNEADRAQAEADRAQQQADQKQAQAEAASAQDKAQSEATAEQDKAQAQAEQARQEASQSSADAKADFEQANADARSERDAAEQAADRKEAEAKQEFEQSKAEAEEQRDRAEQQAASDRAEARREIDQQVADGRLSPEEGQRELQHRLAEIDSAQHQANEQADAAEAAAMKEYDQQRAEAQADRADARADADQARREARAAYDQRLGDVQAEYDRANGGDKGMEELIRQRVADLPQPPDLSSHQAAANSPYASSFNDNLYNQDDLAYALGREGADAPGTGGPSGSQGGSPGMMPPPMRGAGGGESGGSGERTRNVLDSGVSRPSRGMSPPPTVEEEEHRVAPRGTQTSSNNAPFMPPMGGGGPGGGEQQTQSGDRERVSWLTEDEDVWGADEGGAPQALGR